MTGKGKTSQGARELSAKFSHEKRVTYTPGAVLTPTGERILASLTDAELLGLIVAAEKMLEDDFMKRSLVPVDTWHKIDKFRKELERWRVGQVKV